MKRIILSLIIIYSFTIQVISQEVFNKEVSLEWIENEISTPFDLENTTKFLTFRGSAFDYKTPEVSRYLDHIPLPNFGNLDISITPLKTSPITIKEEAAKSILTSEFEIEYNIVQERFNSQANISITPIRKTKDGFEKLEAFIYKVKFTPSLPLATTRDGDHTYESVLSTGTTFKIAIPKEGVYKIDGQFLSEFLDIDLGSLNADNLQLFGNIGGRLPKACAADQPDDLLEIPLFMQDGGDGNISNDDFFLFYADGADKWTFDPIEKEYSNVKNVYDVNNYVFLKIDGANGARLTPKNSTGSASYESRDFDYLQIFEDDRTNLLGAFGSTEGTGKDWYGDYFAQETNRSYESKFDISELGLIPAANIKMRFAARGENQTTTILSVNGENYQKNAPGTTLSDIEDDYAKPIIIENDVNLNENQNSIEIEYVRSTPQDEGWLDYIQLEYRKLLSTKYDQIRISDKNSLDHEKASFITPSGNISIWNVTDPNNTSIIVPTGSKVVYDVDDKLNSFYMVNEDNYLTPEAIGPVSNQNLHAIDRADLLIVYHPNFADAAKKLGDHRRSFSGLEVAEVDILEIYNEFSSGRKDPTALRDFSRMVLSRDAGYRYLLLLGDGTYDYRNLTPNLLDHNFIPVYETEESLDPINGYPSDDYYALLSDDEGNNLSGALDVAVGRIPVTDSQMALGVVNKIISYDTNKKAYGDWRLKIGFAADDEDTNLHLTQADQIAEDVEREDPIYNQYKVYFDSYVQESTPGGDRYPAASEAINSSMQAGSLVLNYMGHGGPKGWSQERVLKISDIETWNNTDQLPLLITATCSFTGYDDPSIISAGEAAIQKINGGVIGLLTTVRAVYSSENQRLTEAVFKRIFRKVDGKPQTLGEIITSAKNQNADSGSFANDRKFSLIGDPSQQLAAPKYNVQTTSINDNATSSLDTLNALDKVTIKGNITDEVGNILTDFNGKVFPTIFDKESTLTTLANDSRSFKRDFGVYRNILFKGQATVTNGEFEFTFVMPKDINYEFGTGRISYYAYDGDLRDAAGNFNSIIIGGSNPNAEIDDLGPVVELYMNNESFVFGGTTNSSPTLLALLSDDFGINVSGTSIGHDITAVLDDDSKNSFILNEFYEANVDDYTSGVVRFPLKYLSPGAHSITLKAWDVSNNSSESRIEFVVEDKEEGSLSNVYNYPNPFSTNTTFLFEHDLANSDLDVFVDIYTVSGKLVTTIEKSIFSSGNQVNEITWNAKDDFGSSLATGLYLFKIKAISRSSNQMRESDFQKIVIL